MDKLLCPFWDELGNPCNRPMYALPPESLPSNGVEITIWQCFSLNDHHKCENKEPIPGWPKEREINTRAIRVRTSDEKQLKILTMLAQSIPYAEISEKMSCSYTTICRIKQITVLAAMSIVLNNLNCERRIL